MDLDPASRGDPARRRLLQSCIGSETCWIAEGDGAILGCVLLNYSFYGNGFVPLLLVAEPFRRQGIGERLLRHAAFQCKTQKLFTSTNESNDAMRELLRKTGFESSGIIYNLDTDDP